MIDNVASIHAKPPPSRVRINAIANYLGRGGAILVNLACLPLFLSILGSEAFGLIGAFALIQAWALLLDFGLTPTLNREIARARSGSRTWQSVADLTRTIEIVSASLAALIVLVVAVGAPLLATTWLTPVSLSRATVANAIGLMGLLAAMRWLEQVYRGAIQGSEDQVWLNVVQAGAESARWLGALAIMAWVMPSVLVFFVWNVVISLLSLLLLRHRLMRLLNRHGIVRSRFAAFELVGIRAFAGGMFLNSILTFLITQADRLVVSNVLSLRDFGIYALVAAAAIGLTQLVQPLTVAILPRLTALVETRRARELTAAFHATGQWLAAIVLPVGLCIAVLPAHALLAWTGQPAVAAQGAPILTLLVMGTLINAMMNVPYMLQLAHGWTAITNTFNAALLAVFIPVLVWAAKSWGAVGAAATFAGMNLLCLVTVSKLVIDRLQPAETIRWYSEAVIAPALVGLTVAIAARLALPAATDRIAAFVQLGVAYTVIAVAVVLVLRQPRRRALALLTVAVQRVRPPA